jgi:hypothetical protein
MKHTSKFTFSIALILLSFLVNAQQKKTDSIPPKIERFGIRFGADIFKLTRSFYDKNYKGIEFVGDYRLTKNYYLAAELGNENKTTEDDRLNTTAKGTYIKVGFDYNSYENWLDMRNMVFIGLRYGASTFSQQLNSYKLYNTSTYFPEAPTVVSGEKFNGLSAQWFEVVVGMKAEVLKNIYVGFSVRMNKILSNTKPENFDNLYIPGFNRTYNGDFGVGFNYTVSYFLPIYKTKSSPKKVVKKK